MDRGVSALVAGAVLLLFVGGAVVAGFLGLTQGSFAGGVSCEWTPVGNGDYSSLSELRNDYPGDFSEDREGVEFRVNDGVLEFRYENRERCERSGLQG